jgi:hypothetical protein
MQEPQPLGHNLLNEDICTGRIAAGPGEARNKTKPNWVITDKEDDRDCRCCGLGRDRSRIIRRGYNGHMSADQISHHCRQLIISTREPMVLDRHVLAFDVASFVEAFAERRCAGRRGIERPNFDKSNHRHGWLLRAC